jgi:phosphoribosylanthranilate isomerase
MTWIKICGTTTAEDARIAFEAGADAVGFVFYEKSPRNVAAEQVRRIVAELPSTVEKIGVFPRHSSLAARDQARELGLTGVQLYPMNGAEAGKGRAASPIELGDLRVLWTLPAALFLEQGMEWMQSEVGDAHAPVILLDSSSGSQIGGTGRTFDWEQAAPLVEMMAQETKVVVAGGLNPDNVAEALAILKPWGVDVVSGVEARPGKKDAGKVKAFVAAVRGSEKRQ